MFGKHYESMYTGSMIGAGAVAFAVMGYVISKQRPSREYGSVVEINPELLAFIIGETVNNIEKALEFLCAPDKNSRTPDEEGRRLVRLDQFNYKVVNGAKYRAMRDLDRRRETDRESKRRQRERRRPEIGGKDVESRVDNGRIGEGGL